MFGAVASQIIDSGSRVVVTRQSNFDFSLHVAPLFTRPQFFQQFVKSPLILRGELEPGQKIKWLAQVAAMVQSPGNPWKIGETNGRVPRSLLINSPPLVLAKSPPR